MSLTTSVSQIMKVLSGLGLEERQEPFDNAPRVGTGNTAATREVNTVGPKWRRNNRAEIGNNRLGEGKSSSRVRISEQREVRISSDSEWEEKRPRHVSELRRDRENRHRSSEERSSRDSSGKKAKI